MYCMYLLVMCRMKVPKYCTFVQQEMPVEAMYAPPLNIKVYDKRKFGHTPLVGSHVISSLERYKRRDAADRMSALNSMCAGITVLSQKKLHHLHFRSSCSAASRWRCSATSGHTYGGVRM